MKRAQEVRTEVCPHGPLLVRGASAWPDSDGDMHLVERPVVAVCRCDRSQRLPWCDGTHKLMPPGWDTADTADSSGTTGTQTVDAMDRER